MGPWTQNGWRAKQEVDCEGKGGASLAGFKTAIVFESACKVLVESAGMRPVGMSGTRRRVEVWQCGASVGESDADM